MSPKLPDIPPEERTPLVLQLLDVLQQQEVLIQQLRDEIAVLKGQKPRPKIAPSRLEQATISRSAGEGPQRCGSAKDSKNAQLTIHAEVPLSVPDPPGAPR
jgi:hypothetical protein